MNDYQVAIIGAGGAGQMATLRSVLNNLKTVVFTGDKNAKKRGRAMWVHSVENMPGYFDMKRPITNSTKETFTFLKNHENLNERFDQVNDSVIKISKTENGFHLKTAEQNYTADYVVLCTGTMDVQPEIDGKIDGIFPFANKGDIDYCIRCDGHKIIGHKTVIIGNSMAAPWIAVMLKERYNPPKLTVLFHDSQVEIPEELNHYLKMYDIDVITSSITNYLGSAKEGFQGLELTNGKTLSVTKGIVALGTIVYNQLAKQLGVELNERDHLIVNEKFETNISGFYAAGDLVAGKKKQIYTSWDMAVDAVDDIDHKIRKAKRQKRLQEFLS